MAWVGGSGGSGNSNSGWSRGRAISSRTKVTGSRQALRPQPLTIAGQPDCKQQRIYGTIHHTEATSELCLPPVSQERLTSILVLGHQRNQTEVRKYNPRPTSQGSKPDGRWPAPRPWADREGATGVQTRPGGFFPPGPARTTAILPKGSQGDLAGKTKPANRHSPRRT